MSVRWHIAQLGELGEGSLPPAEEYQHQQIHEGECERVSVIAGSVDDQDTVTGTGRLSASAQDGGGVVVVPVMQDACKEVEVTAGGQRIKKVPRDCAGSVGQPSAGLLLGLALLDLFQRRFDAARSFLEQTDTVFAELGDRHGAALVAFGSGVAQGLSGQLDQCLHSFHAALTTFRETADLPGRPTRISQSGAHTSATFQRCFGLSRKLGHRTGETLAQHFLARLYIQDRGGDR